MRMVEAKARKLLNETQAETPANYYNNPVNYDILDKTPHSAILFP
jgi:hypothetical protein